jgi:PIN domain nuclease of toxin-antitoxin system
VIVLDTHALVWWLAQSPKLSARARRAINAAQRRGPVVASAISIFEIATLVRRGRLQLGVSMEQWLGAARALPELRIVPVTDEIAQLAGGFAEPMHGDSADRMIASTAIMLGAKLVTADERLGGFPGLAAVW